MAIYKTELRITQERLKDPRTTDEVIQRQMALKLIRDIPLELLQRLFDFEKLDPLSEEAKSALAAHFVPDRLKEKIVYLRETKQVEYYASINVAQTSF